MLRLLPLLGLLALAACKKSHSDQLRDAMDRDQSISVNGISRSYDVYAPEGQQNSPLVLLLHGHGGSAEELMGHTRQRAPYARWLHIAKCSNVVLAIPNGEKGSSGKTAWNDCRSDGTGNSSVDDVAFIDALIDELASAYSIDTNRVYVQGTSNGGHMTIRLLQELPQRFAAAAVVAAALPASAECASSTVPVSVAFMNGMEDPFMPYAGGSMINNRGTVLSTDASIDYWVERNGCNPTPETVAYTDLDSKDKSTVARHTYVNGINNTEVVLFQVVGGAHTEPSRNEHYRRAIKKIIGPQTRDLEMAEELWKFFQPKSR